MDTALDIFDHWATLAAKVQTEQLIARWRRAHPEATCSDAIALRLAEMAASVGRLA